MGNAILVIFKPEQCQNSQELKGMSEPSIISGEQKQLYSCERLPSRLFPISCSSRLMSSFTRVCRGGKLTKNTINPSKRGGSHPSTQLCRLLITLQSLTALAEDQQPKTRGGKGRIRHFFLGLGLQAIKAEKQG